MIIGFRKPTKINRFQPHRKFVIFAKLEGRGYIFFDWVWRRRCRGKYEMSRHEWWEYALQLDDFKNEETPNNTPKRGKSYMPKSSAPYTPGERQAIAERRMDSSPSIQASLSMYDARIIDNNRSESTYSINAKDIDHARSLAVKEANPGDVVIVTTRGVNYVGAMSYHVQRYMIVTGLPIGELYPIHFNGDMLNMIQVIDKAVPLADLMEEALVLLITPADNETIPITDWKSAVQFKTQRISD